MKRMMLVLLASLFLAACVPTPDESIVIGKDNEAMIEKSKATDAPASAGIALREQLGCPEVFSVAYTDETKKIQITGDAGVILPDTDGVPLLYVEADRFRQETVYAFLYPKKDRSLLGTILCDLYQKVFQFSVCLFRFIRESP